MNQQQSSIGIQEPTSTHGIDIYRLYAFISISWRQPFKDNWSKKSHDYSTGCMKSEGIGKGINDQSENKTEQHKWHCSHLKRQHKNEQGVNHCVQPQTRFQVIQNQYLKQYK